MEEGQENNQEYNFNLSESFFEDLDKAIEEGIDSKSQLFRNACLWFCDYLGSRKGGKDNNGKKKTFTVSSNLIKDYWFDYDTLIRFLKHNKFITVLKSLSNLAPTILLDSKYKGNCERELTIDEVKSSDKIYKKGQTRALKIVGDFDICLMNVDGSLMTDNDVEKVLRNNKNSKGKDYTEKSIQDQKEIVKKINEDRKLEEDLHARRSGRFYFSLTSIGDCLSKHLILNNKEATLLDSHATYLWFLPAMIRKTISANQWSKELSEELIDFETTLNQIQEDKGNLYETFANLYNTGLTKDDVKTNMLSWLCDPNSSFISGEVKEKIEEGFSDFYPAIRRYLKLQSSGKTEVSKRITKIESDLFIGVCKELVKNNISAIPKHDCIIVEKEYSKQARELLETRFKEKYGYNLFLKNKGESRLEIPFGSANAPFDSLTGQNQKPITSKEEDRGEADIPSLSVFSKTGSLTGQNPILNGAKRNRPSEITTKKDGRYKFKSIMSKKNETKEQFKTRLITELGYSESDFKKEIDMEENQVVAKNEQAAGNQESIKTKEGEE